MALAETVAILMRYAAIREVNLKTEVQKPSLAIVLAFKGARMECAIESTPHEETCIYTSVVEGGNLMQKFKDDELQGMLDDGDEPRRQSYPIRASGIYATVQKPWPRNGEKEARDIAGATKRKLYPHRRQGNRWDKYGESSSAASSEAHIASDHVHSESTWGPYESAHRDVQEDTSTLSTSKGQSASASSLLLDQPRLGEEYPPTSVRRSPEND